MTSPRDVERRLRELERRADAAKVPVDVVVVYVDAVDGSEREAMRRTVLVDPETAAEMRLRSMGARRVPWLSTD